MNLTVHFLKPGLSRDTSGGVLVQRTKVTSKLELLMDVDLLVAEDWIELVKSAKHICDHSQTTPRSATSRALQ